MPYAKASALLMTLYYLTAVIAFTDQSDGIFDNFEEVVTVEKGTEGYRPCSWFTTCLCKSSYVDCSQRDLAYIPDQIPAYVTSLKLNGNRINEIKPGIFQNLSNLIDLDLSHNNIKRLQVDSFQGLGKLTKLNLNKNKIRYTSSNIHLGVFKPLTRLIYLYIQQDLDTFQLNEDYPLQQLAEVPTLISLRMDVWFTKTINENFSKLMSLHTFESSGDDGRCTFIKIRENGFKTIKHLTQLTLSNCNISLVENNSFSELTKLKILDLSHNTALEFKSLPNITFGIRKRNLTKLKLNSIHPIVGDCTRLEVDHLKYTSEMKIKYLYLAGNRLSFVNESAIDLVPRSMEGLYLKNNRFAFGNYILKSLTNGLFTNVQILIISQQDASTVLSDQLQWVTARLFAGTHQSRKGNKTKNPISSTAEMKANISVASKMKIPEIRQMNNVTSDNQYCSNCFRLNATLVPLSTNLSYVDLSDQKSRQQLKSFCFCEPNNLRKVYLQKNVIWSVQGPFYGLKELRVLNLALNSCENISKVAFRSMPNLLFLYLDNNFLSDSLNADENGEIFIHLKKLQVLTISDNKLRSLPINIFKGLNDLIMLNLSHNFLTDFNLHLTHMKKLTILFLQNNLLETISNDVRVHLDYLASSRNLSIDLSENKLKCGCKNIELLDWFAETHVEFVNFKTYMCEYENGSMEYISVAATRRDELRKDCADYRVLIIASVCTFLICLIVIAAGIVYRYRWDLRYMYYSAKTRWNRNENGYIHVADADAEESEFEYDAFVSYAAKDGAFVKESVTQELEDQRNMKLLIHDRDFRAGEFVNDNIMRAIITSRKTLIILSKAFLKSHWCRFEMNMARMESIKTGRNVLSVLMMEDIPTKGLPLEVIDIIRNRTYLELPDLMDHSDIFWDRLKDAITS